MPPTTRPCSAPTPSGPCQHPVPPPNNRCWQHDGKTITIQTAVWSKPDGERPPVVWEYRDCAFTIADRGTQIRCLIHDDDPNWSTAQALGGVPPCAALDDGPPVPLQQRYEQALMTRGHPGFPTELQAMVQYGRDQVPRSAIDSKGQVMQSFLHGQAVPDTATCQKWGYPPPTPSAYRAIEWLEEQQVDPADWIDKTNNPVRIVALLRAGITAKQLSAYRGRIPHCAPWSLAVAPRVGQLKRLLQSVSPQQLQLYVDTEVWLVDSLIEPVHVVAVFVEAVLRGMTPTEFAALGTAITGQHLGVEIGTLRDWIESAKSAPPRDAAQ